MGECMLIPTVTLLPNFYVVYMKTEKGNVSLLQQKAQKCLLMSKQSILTFEQEEISHLN